MASSTNTPPAFCIDTGNLEKLHPCPTFDEYITFHDYYDDPVTKTVREHVYLVNEPDRQNTRPLIYDYSVTTFVHSKFPHFDPEATATKIIGGRKWRVDPSYKYYQKSREQILTEWKDNGREASTLGTAMHEAIERFYNHPNLWTIRDQSKITALMLESGFSKDETYGRELQQFLAFHMMGPLQWGWVPWRTELRVFDTKLRVAGSVDMLYKSPDYTEKTPNLVMFDWKRSREISFTNSYGKRATCPSLAHLSDCNFVKYSLQLNVYKRIIERNTKYRIVYMALGVFHPTFDHYQVCPVNVMEAEVDALFADRYRSINNHIYSNQHASSLTQPNVKL